jgi:hypothetical protein
MYILAFIGLVIITSIVMFIQKVVMKGNLERGLSRRVQDNELTSITAWMNAGPAVGQSNRAPDSQAAATRLDK